MAVLGRFYRERHCSQSTHDNNILGVVGDREQAVNRNSCHINVKETGYLDFFKNHLRHAGFAAPPSHLLLSSKLKSFM